MKLVWSGSARMDRKEIGEYVAQVSMSAALTLDQLISEKAKLLAVHPGLGRPGRVPGTREFVISRSYLLIYDLPPGVVRILAVVHAARQWPPVRD